MHKAAGLVLDQAGCRHVGRLDDSGSLHLCTMRLTSSRREGPEDKVEGFLKGRGAWSASLSAGKATAVGSFSFYGSCEFARASHVFAANVTSYGHRVTFV